MLVAGKVYLDNASRRVSIGGRVRDYSAEEPYVWAFSGDWYHEITGEFVMYMRQGGYDVLPLHHRRSIKDHTAVVVADT